MSEPSAARASAPQVPGPQAPGAQAPGPRTAGPQSSGPLSSGPRTAEPQLSGPQSSGPERPGGIYPQATGADVDPYDDDARPLPDLPPLPADPRWRVEHLPMLSATSMALLLCAASVGLLVGGPVAAFAAAAGVLMVTVSFTMSTLVIAWADTVRPALLMPLGLLTYVVKYTLLGVILAFVVNSDWAGRVPLGWGVVAGVLGWTAVQIWWVARTLGRK